MKEIFVQLTAGSVLAFALGSTALGAAQKTPTLAVARVATGPITGTEAAAVGEQVRNMFFSELPRLRGVAVREAVPAEDSVAVAGTDYLLRVSVSRYSVRTNGLAVKGFKLPFENFAQNVVCELQLDWRIVDSTSLVIAQGAAAGKSQVGKAVVNTGEGNVAIGNEHAGSVVRDNALRDAMKTVARDFSTVSISARSIAAPQEIVGGSGPAAEQGSAGTSLATPATAAEKKGTVILVRGDRLVLSVNSGQGFKAGDKLNVFEKVEEINKAGVKIALHIPLGEIVLTSVGSSQSQAAVTGGMKFAEGLIVADPSVSLD